MDIDRDDLDHKANVYQVQSSEVMKNGSKFCLGKPNVRTDDVVYNIYSVTEENNVDAKIGTYTLPMDKYKEFGDISADGFENLKAFTLLGEPTLFQTLSVKPDPKKAASPGKGKSFAAFSTKFDVVKVDGDGNCFFYAVHECLKTSDKFKKYHGEGSEKFAQNIRALAAPQVTAKQFIHAKEQYFATLDHAGYVAAFNRVNEMKASQDAEEGDVVFLDRWCYAHADGKFEELSEKGAQGYNHGMPFQPMWGLDTATDEEKQEEFVQEHVDVDPDIVQHVEHFKMDKWSELQDFMKTKKYWVDEMVMYAISDLLKVNFVVVEVENDKLQVVRCFHNHPDYVLLLRKGPHYSALLHKGDQKGVWSKAELPAEITTAACCVSGKSEMVDDRKFVKEGEKNAKKSTSEKKVKEKEDKDEEEKDEEVKEAEKTEPEKKKVKDKEVEKTEEPEKKKAKEVKEVKEVKEEVEKTIEVKEEVEKTEKEEKEPEKKKAKSEVIEKADEPEKKKRVKKEDSRTRAGKPLAGTRKKNKL